MPLKSYGVLIGRPVNSRLGTVSNAHYHIHLVDDTTDYRVAVNVKSQLAPSEVEYLVDENLRHPVTDLLGVLPLGYNRLTPQPGTAALDFIRGNLFDKADMKPLPFSVPGSDNDLNEKLDKHIQLAMGDEDALVYAFGERWGPEDDVKDKIFGFRPGNGIHDIHMNQGNVGRFVDQDGIYQDGALLIHFPSESRWVGIFLKFQSQAWNTDEDGHTVEMGEPGAPKPVVTRPAVRIVAALVNPLGEDQGNETVTILNASPSEVDLSGYGLANKEKARQGLSGKLPSGAATVVTLASDVPLGNKGGLITLLDPKGRKVDGVSYTAEDARDQGWTVVF